MSSNVVQLNPDMEMVGNYHIPVSLPQRQVTLSWETLESMFLDGIITPKLLVYLGFQALYPNLSCGTAIASVSPEKFILEFPRIVVENGNRIAKGKKPLLSSAKVAVAIHQLIESELLAGESSSVQIVQLYLPVGE